MTLNLSPQYLLCACLTLALCITATPTARADVFGLFTYTDNGSSITITGYPKSATGAVEIPASIIAKPVTSIGSQAFSACTGLTSVTIPNTVTSVGSFAFQGCTGLTSVTIPNSTTSIESGAFAACTGLTTITVDPLSANYSSAEGVLFNKNTTTLVQYPGGKAGSYTILNSVTSIGSYAFLSCSGLTSVTIGSGVTSIESGAFASCTGLNSVMIPNNVTSIGSSAFNGCPGLTSVTIPSSVTSIGSSAFSSCAGLISIIVDPLNSNFGSADGVLFNKNTTTLIQYPEGKAGSYTIPNSVTSIGYYAFLSCSGLTSVTIGSGVTSIESGAFASCTGLNSVMIPNNVTSIGSNAFNSCPGLTSVTIPSSVTSIGSGAFSSCAGLISVTIGGGVTSIGSSAFQSCTGLTNVTIGSGVTSIGSSAFLICPKLITVYIKGNAPTLGATVFTANSKSNVYYLSGTTGWTSTYGGLSTVPVSGLPTITGQPSSVIANAGENAAFTVIAKTNFPLTLSYQWQRNGLVIPSATAPSLYLNNIQSANVGIYTVIIINDTGSVSSTATLTLTQGTLYTQAQYDSALQTGLNAGLAVGMATGRAQVTNFPNDYGLYNLTQVQALNVGTPLLTKNQVSGKFKLTIGVKKSSDLLSFIPFPIPTGAALLNPQGEMEFQFTSPDNAAFYRLESR